MSIEKMLCLSTGHISQETAEALRLGVLNSSIDHDERDEEAPEWFSQLIVYDHAEYGWLIALCGQIRPEGETEGYDYRDGLPTELRACMDHATANDCYWLLLDQDADLIDELPSFDW